MWKDIYNLQSTPTPTFDILNSIYIWDYYILSCYLTGGTLDIHRKADYMHKTSQSVSFLILIQIKKMKSDQIIQIFQWKNGTFVFRSNSWSKSSSCNFSPIASALRTCSMLFIVAQKAFISDGVNEGGNWPQNPSWASWAINLSV